MSRKFKFCLNLTRITGTSHEDLYACVGLVFLVLVYSLLKITLRYLNMYELMLTKNCTLMFVVCILLSAFFWGGRGNILNVIKPTDIN